MSNPSTTTWDDLRKSTKKEGNPFLTNPTRAMVYDLETPRYKSYLIGGIEQNFYVEYNRQYALEWCRNKLAFLSTMPTEDRDKFLSEVFDSQN